MDSLQVHRYKKTILDGLKRLPPANFMSIPVEGADVEALSLAVNQIVAESGGKWMYTSMGASISIGRKLAFKGAMSAEALQHLEEKGLAVSAETAADWGNELPADLSIPKESARADGADVQSAFDALKAAMGGG